MKTMEVKVGNVIIGGDNPIVVQTMCNTHTSDVEASVAQCIRLAKAGAQMIRLTVPSLAQIEDLRAIRTRLRDKGIEVPLVADVHFSSEIAIAAASVVEKVRINPGNFHKDHEKAKEQFKKLVEVCKENGTAIRIGLNHGSLGDRITNLYGNTPLAMKEAVMEWLKMCVENDFYNVVVSLKASNTFVMVEAYRLLAKEMEESGVVFPLHLGVTEAGNGDGGRIKSAVGISALLSEGIGNTIRVSLTEDPENEIPVAQYLADRYDHKIHSSMVSLTLEGKKAIATYDAPTRERLLLDFSCDFGKRLLDKELDEVELIGCEDAEYLVDSEGYNYEAKSTQYNEDGSKLVCEYTNDGDIVRETKVKADGTNEYDYTMVYTYGDNAKKTNEKTYDGEKLIKEIPLFASEDVCVKQGTENKNIFDRLLSLFDSWWKNGR